jgi:hypothetical protein
MPGKSARERAVTTLITLLALLMDGHDLRSGPFRVHIKRMMDYLDKALPSMRSQPEYEIARRAVEAIRAGRVVPGNWLERALDMANASPGTVDSVWKELETAFP